MNCCVKKEKNLLLLKSVLWVTLASAAVLLLLHHGAPVENEKKFFGGSVYLLVAQTPGDHVQFARWAELNRPSNIFGYNSKGIFSKAVPQPEGAVLPVLRSKNLPSFLPLPLPVGREEDLFTPVAVEKKSPGNVFPIANAGNEKAPFVFSGVQVFNEKGDVAAILHGIPGTGGTKPLLIRSRVNNISGTEFSVMESSGDHKFDRSVTDALTQRTLRGENFNGIFAVWPESRGGSR